MAYETGDFDATILAAAGENVALLGELRAEFGESVERNIDLLRRSRCDANWRQAAQRLHSLGASFRATELVSLSEEAVDGAPGDPVIIRKLEHFSSTFS